MKNRLLKSGAPNNNTRIRSEALAKSKVSQYIDAITSIYNAINPSRHLFFRGHSKKSFLLIPSLFRNSSYKERNIVLDFQHYAPFHEISYNFIDERDKVLADMQHYGMPTRLLDWTLAPLHALFFACSDNHSEDGQLIIFDPWAYWLKIIGNNKRKDRDIHQIHITGRALLSAGWGFEKIKKYIAHKYKYNKLTAKDLDSPFFFIANYTNSRILHQRGSFSIHGRNTNPIDDIKEAADCIRRIDIRASDKKSVMQELNYLYINHYSIYPDFDGMQKMIQSRGGLFSLKSIQQV